MKQKPKIFINNLEFDWYGGSKFYFPHEQQ